MKFIVSTVLCAAAACFLSGEVASGAAVTAVATKTNLRTLEWGGPDGGRDNGPDDHNHDEKDREDKDHDEKDREEREREEREHENDRDHEDEREREEKEREEKEKEEQERREQEERQREEDRQREEGRFDCPPDRPWLCAPTVTPTLAPTALPTLAPTFEATTTGIFGTGVFGSGNITQDAEIGLAFGVALAVCGAFVALFVVAYRHDLHKILAMKVLRSDSPSFNPRMHEHGTAIDISSRQDDSSRGIAMSQAGPGDPEWGVSPSGAVEPKKSRKSRSGKTIDF